MAENSPAISLIFLRLFTQNTNVNIMVVLEEKPRGSKSLASIPWGLQTLAHFTFNGNPHDSAFINFTQSSRFKDRQTYIRSVCQHGFFSLSFLYLCVWKYFITPTARTSLGTFPTVGFCSVSFTIPVFNYCWSQSLQDQPLRFLVTSFPNFLGHPHQTRICACTQEESNSIKLIAKKSTNHFHSPRR